MTLRLSTLLFPLFLALGGTVAWADEPGPTSRPAEPATPAEPAAPEATKAPLKAGPFDLRRIQADLKLDEETTQKLHATIVAMAKTRREKLEALREGGEPDKKARRALDRELRKELMGKIRDVLGKDRFQEFRKLERTRRQAEGKGKGKGKAKGKQKNQGRQRGQQALSPEAVLKGLRLSEEEAAVVRPLVESYLETQELLRGEAQRRRAVFVKAVGETEDPAQLERLLRDYRQACSEDEATIAKSRTRFVEVLTPAQEAKCVAMGLLR